MNESLNYIYIYHSFLGFFMKQLAIAVIAHKITTIHMGVCLLGSSATIGAKIVAILQTRLHIPSDVAVKRVGNKAELPK